MVELMGPAKARGYDVHHSFVALNSPEKNIGRIQEAVPSLQARRDRYKTPACPPEAFPEKLRGYAF